MINFLVRDEFIKRIIKLLKIENKKMTVSDIAAFLKYKNIDDIKKLCKEMYQNGAISFAGNGRYFILTKNHKQKKQKKRKPSRIENSHAVYLEKELKLITSIIIDKGLITEEDYEAKKKELLGL